MPRISKHKCDWCHYADQDSLCTCRFRCDSCGTEHEAGSHSVTQCVINLKKQLDDIRNQNEGILDDKLRAARTLAIDDTIAAMADHWVKFGPAKTWKELVADVLAILNPVCKHGCANKIGQTCDICSKTVPGIYAKDVPIEKPWGMSGYKEVETTPITLGQIWDELRKQSARLSRLEGKNNG